jgi:biopolymer transport protein ExbB
MTNKWLASSLVVMVLSPATLLYAGDVADEPTPGPSLLDVVAGGGVVGFVIILVSVAAVALVVEHFLTLRRSKLLPNGLAQQVESLLVQNQPAAARSACAADGSFLARILDAGLGQIGSSLGYIDIQTASQEESERLVGKLHRKVEMLAFVAAAAPMLGLLGTVTGMMRSFNTIALTEGAANASQLAGGISEALVTTCEGLVVAIPAMFFVSFFRTRIDDAVAEAESLLDRVFRRFRTA